VPERKAGEPLNSFISRFVSNKTEKRKVPNLKQRLAIGYSEAKAKRK
jgi:hypothetical protein